MKGSDKAVF